jgi:hypothetical protein
MLELKWYNFVVQPNAYNSMLKEKEIYLTCVDTCIKKNNNTFKLLSDYIMILNPIKFGFF